MICETCHGTGWIRLKSPILYAHPRLGQIVTDHVPCEDCIGGTASCCDAGGSAPRHPLYLSRDAKPIVWRVGTPTT